MFNYMNSLVTDIKSNGIVLEVNNIGYFIYVSNPYIFSINNKYKVYLYHQVKEDEMNLFGFKDREEKDLFLKLIDVKGLGCKMALPILATGSIKGIKEAIETENTSYLKKSINSILKVVTVLIVPTAVLLFVSQYFYNKNSQSSY